MNKLKTVLIKRKEKKIDVNFRNKNGEILANIVIKKKKKTWYYYLIFSKILLMMYILFSTFNDYNDLDCNWIYWRDPYTNHNFLHLCAIHYPDIMNETQVFRHHS